jgi:hypothetical protein
MTDLHQFPKYRYKHVIVIGITVGFYQIGQLSPSSGGGAAMWPISLVPIFGSLRREKKLHVLSPRANYTDRATASCWRSDCQLLRMKVLRGQRDGSLRPYSRF